VEAISTMNARTMYFFIFLKVSFSLYNSQNGDLLQSYGYFL